MKRYASVVILSQNTRQAPKVVRLKKTHGPAKLVGKFNFTGGHIEEGETAAQAAAREAMEETGLEFNPDELRQIGYKKSPGEWELFVFVGYHSTPEMARSLTDEEVSVGDVSVIVQDAISNPERFSPDFLSLLALALEASPDRKSLS